MITAALGDHAVIEPAATEPATTEPVPRVALLARAGTACERLQVALREAGAELVLVADPSETDAANVRAAGAQAILIALEPLVEDALDRYDVLLADPAITVIFDEAELAAQREGWDAARWSRHLAAKLRRHDNVLPPGADNDDAMASTAPALPSPQPDRQPEPVFDFSSLTLADPVPDIAVPDVAVPNAQDAPRFDDPNASYEPAMLQPEVLEHELLEPIKRDHPAVSDRFHRELEDLQAHTATIDLPGPASAQSDSQATSGAVVVLAGIGGPDAVRQFLAVLPGGFPRPILIQQRLDGGNHEKLVRQMQRATKLPVCLAEVGSTLQSGQVYILPAGVLPEPEDGELRFRQDDVSLPAFQHLPPADSAVLMLSGSDPTMVDAAMSQSWGGAMVAGQSPEGCFDGAAAEALIARGAASEAPADLARQLSQRWLSLKD